VSHVAGANELLLPFARMFARWRLLALLTLWITVLGAVGLLSARPTWRVDDRVSQAGEIGTLPARRSEATELERKLDDDAPAHPPTRGELAQQTFTDTTPAARRSSIRRTVERFGPSNPRGPPLLF
jgi:hypothetical protein